MLISFWDKDWNRVYDSSKSEWTPGEFAQMWVLMTGDPLHWTRDWFGQRQSGRVELAVNGVKYVTEPDYLSKVNVWPSPFSAVAVQREPVSEFARQCIEADKASRSRAKFEQDARDGAPYPIARQFPRQWPSVKDAVLTAVVMGERQGYAQGGIVGAAMLAKNASGRVEEVRRVNLHMDTVTRTVQGDIEKITVKATPA
ncbi:hypothetical protein CH253_08215 [Rhodococcus sp. 06-156-3C]|uniref:hypothetical protein n=1 Tax=Rhodococcus sp. 06-156-3C TaxID=2022486 RepID=UPI000B9BD20B|nr:hypothetical protein [Rhodococcus sp. 06-156-3C]OZD23837.1 hypothetical protein CH253_08215 [Rhodococcus sp. 06-156-3C]